MLEIYNGQNLVKNIESVSVGLSISTICNGFNITQRVGNGALSPAFFAGDQIRITYDRISLLIGYIDSIETSISESGCSLEASGREITCDLVDCSLQNISKSWKDATANQIIQNICDEFNISYSPCEKADIKLSKFCSNPGCSAFDTISEVCKKIGALPTSDGLGNIKIVDPEGYEYSTQILQQGLNVVSASAAFDYTERFSNYFVYTSADPKIKKYGEATDEVITRKRPLVIIDDGYGSKEQADARAAYEVQIRSAKSVSINAMVQGVKNNGSLWVPGTLIDCVIPAFFGGEPKTLLIDSVELTFSENGTFTNLHLVNNDLFTTPPKKSGKAVKSKPDPWNTIRSKTNAGTK